MSVFFTERGTKPRGTAYIVQCKGCRKNIPAGINAAPKDSIRVDCKLCGEMRMYRVAEVFQGLPDGRL